MEGNARGKLDAVKEHSLGANTPVAADVSAAVEGRNVVECLAS